MIATRSEVKMPTYLPRLPRFTLVSDDVSDGSKFDTPQLSGLLGAGGDDISPHLRWRGAPEGDSELRRDDVRSERADRLGVLALGRRGHPTGGHRAQDGRRASQRTRDAGARTPTT